MPIVIVRQLSGNGPTTRFSEEAIIVVTAEQAGEKTVKAMAILMEARIDYICASIKMQAQYWGGKIGDLVEDVENKRKRGDRR